MPLPDEGIKIAALPAASSPDAIDLVGVQAGVTKKLASTLLATQAELDAVNLAAAHLAGAETFTGAKTFTGATAFDLFTGGVTKSLNFRPSLGDNGLSLGIQSKDWSGDTNFDGLQINGSDGIGFGFSGGVLKVMFDSNGQIQATGQGHKFGLGAIGGAAGTYLQIDGDAANVYLRAFGTPANIPMLIASKGTASVKLQTQGGIDQAIFDNGPAASSTVLQLGVSNNSGASMQRVSLGAVDSAGAGFRALRVPN